ncbi:hypothetical protein PG995_012119 [Apiospora arundinis]
MKTKSTKTPKNDPSISNGCEIIIADDAKPACLLSQYAVGEALLLDQSQDSRVASDSAGAAADLSTREGSGLRVTGLERAGVARGDTGILGGGDRDRSANGSTALLADLESLALEEAAGAGLEASLLGLLRGLGSILVGAGLDRLLVARGGAGGRGGRDRDDGLEGVITYASSLAGLLAELQSVAAKETGAARAGVELEGLHVNGVGGRGGGDARDGDGEEESGDLGELHLGGVVVGSGGGSGKSGKVMESGKDEYLRDEEEVGEELKATGASG